jgi:hypothetical protein
MIELESEPGFPDGEVVSVIVQRTLPPGDGIRLSAGAWADAGSDLDEWLAQVRRSRVPDYDDIAIRTPEEKP